MNLVVPVNLQALRVAPNDASLITKQPDLFAGPTTSFEGLPWRSPDFREHPGRVSRANLSENVLNPMWGTVTEQLDAGIHLHWALPDGLARGVQMPDGGVAFPTVPNRWLVTRILLREGRAAARQWVVESDRLMTEDEYSDTYHPSSRRKAVAVPVGWSLVAGNDPARDGGALYHPPSRRMGRVFDLGEWQPVESAPDAAPDEALHLDDLARRATPFTPAGPPLRLTAVGASGPTFAAYYPDSRSVFGFHDRYDDLVAGRDTAFEVSYVVIGWHSHGSDDPLRSGMLETALALATEADIPADEEDRLRPGQLRASAVLSAYGWHYDAAEEAPGRTLYSGHLSGLTWDMTPERPDDDPSYPRCYLRPLPNDPTARLAVGSSPSSALAALARHEWQRSPDGEPGPAQPRHTDPDDPIEHDLELLLDALQLGLLHRVGGSGSLADLEQALHQSGFASLEGGQLWTIRARDSAPDPTDPDRFEQPVTHVAADSGLGSSLAALNDAQRRLDALLGTDASARRQIFSDWYHYVHRVGAGAGDDNALVDGLKGYISGQILDLWTKREAAFGLERPPTAATANLPKFFGGPDDYLTLRDGRYSTASPPESLAGQIAAAANEVLDLLDGDAHAGFELRRSERPRYWLPNEPVIVATGESLHPAQRNGTARHLPCRTSGQVLGTLHLTTGPTQLQLGAAEIVAGLSLRGPDPSATGTPEGADTRVLLADVSALLGEACLLDATLSPVLVGMLGSDTDVLEADLEAALRGVGDRIVQAWRAGVPESVPQPMPAVIDDVGASAGRLEVTLPGRAPQGVGLTTRDGDRWEDPFLPLHLVWEARLESFAKGSSDSPRYDPSVVTDRFVLDENAVDLALTGDLPPTQGGTASLGGSVPLSSRTADPLLAQIREHLDSHPEHGPQLQAVIDHLSGKPLLSQALGGLNPALLSRAEGTQLVVFNPFYDSEPPAGDLSQGRDTLDYANVLTHFVAATTAGLTDHLPLREAGFNPLRSGLLSVARVHVVDVFGRKRPVIDASVAADAGKVVVSAQLRPPPGTDAQVHLGPRLAQPARLSFDWIAGNDGRVVTNPEPSTSPITGWVVSNRLDNSLMLFAPSGRALGSLGVFGGQDTVTWQSPPGNPPRPMDSDMAGAELEHLRKFSTFILGRARPFFEALAEAIDVAHAYILPEAGGGAQPASLLAGRPLALARAELRLELAGLPAVDPGLDAVRAAMAANGRDPYDWTLRDDAGLNEVGFPLRLGDPNHHADGLVAFLVDSPDPYDTIYAPAAGQADGSGVRRPAPDTLQLRARPALIPRERPHPDAEARIAALEDTDREAGRLVTLLMDPRAGVHAATGILPVKQITLPEETYTQALEAIEVSFATRPILRGAQGLDLPLLDEGGLAWRWTRPVRQDGVPQPADEDLDPSNTGDRALFNYSPQVAQDGWLKLVPRPSDQEP